MRAIVCVATANIQPQVLRFLESLRAWGNIVQVVVYTPDKMALPCEVRYLPQWWGPGSRISAFRNTAAVLKPDAIMDALKDFSSVLYMDCMDILFAGHLGPLFSECEESGAMIAASPYEFGRALRHRNKDFRRAFPTTEAKEGAPYCNNGVVWCNRRAHWFMQAWKTSIQVDGDRFGRCRGIVGDQEDFNVYFREAVERGEAICLDRKWNFRGQEAHTGFRFENGEVRDLRGDRVIVMHASGTREFPSTAVRFCTSGGSHE